MSTVADIQTAVEKLPEEERFALFGWLEETASVRAEKLRQLRADIDAGLIEADRYEVIPAEEEIARLRARAHRVA